MVCCTKSVIELVGNFSCLVLNGYSFKWDMKLPTKFLLSNLFVVVFQDGEFRFFHNKNRQGFYDLGILLPIIHKDLGGNPSVHLGFVS